ncbi:MAG: insulinase family protein, partial [Bacteroidota bacterium]|nr:insulinase family protein [Bacteroidota bacterium]
SKYFADIPGGAEISRHNVVEPPMNGEVRDIIYDRIQLPAVVQAYRIPANGTPDFYAVDMVNRILSNGNSARLNKSIKDEQQKAIYVGAFSFPFEEPGLAIMFAIANAGIDVKDLEVSMDAEIQRMQKEPVSAEELSKLKAQLETEAIQDNSRVAGVANNLATAHTILGSADLVNKEIDRYLSLTADDLMRAAQTYFTERNRVVLHYLPLSQKPQ